MSPRCSFRLCSATATSSPAPIGAPPHHISAPSGSAPAPPPQDFIPPPFSTLKLELQSLIDEKISHEMSISSIDSKISNLLHSGVTEGVLSAADVLDVFPKHVAALPAPAVPAVPSDRPSRDRVIQILEHRNSKLFGPVDAYLQLSYFDQPRADLVKDLYTKFKNAMMFQVNRAFVDSCQALATELGVEMVDNIATRLQDARFNLDVTFLGFLYSFGLELPLIYRLMVDDIADGQPITELADEILLLKE